MTAQYRHSDFNSADLVALKLQSGAKISVLIPARNESATISGIVSSIKSELIDLVPLVDEIVVADNGSNDDTSVRARAAGALTPVLGEDETPVSMRGKGWTLQRGISQCTGDIIICIDADIRNFDSRFVVGLAGPLLSDSSISFSKAFYRRPIVVDDIKLPDYGGRVTELAARPMLSLFYPDLASIRQPLSGEYAFRRSLATSLPFWSGYGVEVGILINIKRIFDLSIIAEVDMGERIHRNRNISDLGKMSFGILKTIFSELSTDGIICDAPPLGDARLIMPGDGVLGADSPQILLPALNIAKE